MHTGLAFDLSDVFIGPSILIILSGSVTMTCGLTEEPAGKGATIFLPAASPEMRLLLPTQSPGDDVLLFQAYCNS